VQVGLRPMKGAFKRMLAGMPFLLTGAHCLQPRWGRARVRVAPKSRHGGGCARASMARCNGQC
jgi:hypothetical protein